MKTIIAMDSDVGKSGACKFVGYFYERTNERFILKVDSDEFIF